MCIETLIARLQLIRNKHKSIWIEDGKLVISGSGDEPIELNEDLEIE